MPETHIYKKTPDCRIHLDIHKAPTSESPAPAIFWIHGGALIGGSRDRNEDDTARYTNRGYTVFSIDYRLAPETKLPDIISDVQNALTWVRERGPEVAGIDPDRVATIGHSAGGYLALMTGTFPRPPKALVSFYGYGDLVGSWYSKPDPFYCRQPMVTEKDARKNFSGPPVTRPNERPGGGQFYLYCRQQGIWPNEVGGRDPETDPGFFAPYCPEQNVSDTYPPTMLLHGTDDTDVPYDLSVRMAAALKAGKIEHQLVTIQDGGHGFERGNGQADPDAITTACDGVIDFLDAHV
jgi:acetyl esterase/lipase